MHTHVHTRTLSLFYTYSMFIYIFLEITLSHTHEPRSVSFKILVYFKIVTPFQNTSQKACTLFFLQLYTKLLQIFTQALSLSLSLSRPNTHHYQTTTSFFLTTPREISPKSSPSPSQTPLVNTLPGWCYIFFTIFIEFVKSKFTPPPPFDPFLPPPLTTTAPPPAATTTYALTISF